ncbi:MAG: glutamate--tRNA ligase [Deltaproteobacteria bacterium]|nr:MAG: glutamate--tRNA ligase [Deltaproteobacteria bacterium]
MKEVRTRFAPSPTGYLHVGGARTALFNWLFARHHGGKFILRIEDTDQARSKDEYLQDILESLRWLGLHWDEGPYFQSKRMDLYREHAQRLLEEGKAYRCYCTPEELEEMRRQALAEGRKPKYDGRCRSRKDHPEGVPFAIRFKSPQEGVTVVEDLLRGKVTFRNEELDDLIIVRSDGTPTYNFVVVVDDALMGITHVIRGDDHLNNTPRQILLYEALGYPVPKFAHLPLILGTDRTRLSKRHGATAVSAYREMGYLPEAMVNYLARLGWSHGDQEIFSIEELIEKFSLEAVSTSPAVFDPEKLLWLNSHYIKELPAEEIAQRLIPFLAKRGIVVDLDERLVKAVRTLQPRAKTLEEMAEQAVFYFRPPTAYDEKGVRKFFTPAGIAFLEGFKESLKRTPFDPDGLEGAFRKLAEELGLKTRDAAQAVRLALTGKTVSPGLFEVMDVLGKEETISRLQKAITWCRTSECDSKG